MGVVQTAYALNSIVNAYTSGGAGSALSAMMGYANTGLVKTTTAMLKKFYHQTFELRQGKTVLYRHTLLVNPESFSQEEPARVNVSQTLGGIYIDDFGMGVKTVSLAGVTGYKARFNAEMGYVDGYEEFKNFRQHVYRDYLEASDDTYELRWYNWEDQEYYTVQPTHFRLQRSKGESLLYRYEFRFTLLCPVTVDTDDTGTLTLLDFDGNALQTSMGSSLLNLSSGVSSFNLLSGTTTGTSVANAIAGTLPSASTGVFAGSLTDVSSKVTQVTSLGGIKIK